MTKQIITTILDEKEEFVNAIIWTNENDAKAFMFDAIMDGYTIERFRGGDTETLISYFVLR